MPNNTRIRLIYEPTVERKCSSFSFQIHEESDLDQIPEIAGRECYQSFNNPRPGGNAAYLKRILSEGHGSVLEHATVGFRILGVSRNLTHELIRHKAGTAISELSQRYVDLSDIGFVVPPWITDEKMCQALQRHYKDCLRLYQRLVGEFDTDKTCTTLQRKRIREAARAVLPGATETRIVYTANLRAWRNILEQRGNIHADLEIRRLAVLICEELKKIAPNVFQDFEVYVDEDGRQSCKSEYRKV